MPKTNINDILKPNTKLEARIITPKEAEKMIKECKKEQEDSIARKNVDWNELNKIYITI